MSPLYRSKIRALSLGLACWLTLAHRRELRAEDVLSYKYEDYRETNSRMTITTHGVFIGQDLGTDMHLTAEGVIDSIAGATPNGEPAPAGSDQVPLSEMHDRRYAWNVSLARQFPITNISVGYAHSQESDYHSDGLSLNTVTDFNEKNTTLLLGVAGTEDTERVFYQPKWVSIRARNLIAGIGQVLDPNTTISFNVSLERRRGYLADPYRLVRKTITVAPGVTLPQDFPENRPAHRQRWVAYAELNHALPKLNAAIEGTYRFYDDSYGQRAHTWELTWIQKVGSRFRIEPGLRYYVQSAADFYYYNLDNTTIMPTLGGPVRAGPFYSSDYRLSALHTVSYIMKAAWNVTSQMQLNLSYERYNMRGSDGVTPQSAYPQANIINAGAQLSW